MGAGLSQDSKDNQGKASQNAENRSLTKYANKKNAHRKNRHRASIVYTDNSTQVNQNNVADNQVEVILDEDDELASTINATKQKKPFLFKNNRPTLQITLPNEENDEDKQSDSPVSSNFYVKNKGSNEPENNNSSSRPGSIIFN